MSSVWVSESLVAVRGLLHEWGSGRSDVSPVWVIESLSQSEGCCMSGESVGGVGY